MDHSATMRAKHSSHTLMSVTGGFASKQYANCAASARGGSSTHISARRSDISTNWSSRIFFTTLGGKVAAGLYGPDVTSDGAVVACVTCCVFRVVTDVEAAIASRSSPEAWGRGAVNIGISCAESGRAP